MSDGTTMLNTQLLEFCYDAMPVIMFLCPLQQSVTQYLENKNVTKFQQITTVFTFSLLSFFILISLSATFKLYNFLT